SGSYTLQGNSIKIGPLAVTRMMCAEGVMTQEREFLKALESAVRWNRSEERRVGKGGDGERALERKQKGAGTMAGKTGDVTGFNNGRQGVVSPLNGSPIALSFAEGRVSGRTGCNNFNGSYTLAGNSIKIGPLAATRMMCAEDVMTQERQLLKALESAVRWN